MSTPAPTIETGDGSRAAWVDRRGRFVLVAVCLGFFMIQVDATVVNVALPAIGREIGGSFGGLQWVVDSYTLVLAAAMLGAGGVADRIGARRLFELGLIVFTLGWSAFLPLALLAGAAVAEVLFWAAERRPSELPVVLAGSMLLGLCALAMPAMTSVAVGAVAVDRAGLASGVLNASRQSRGALGVAVLAPCSSPGPAIDRASEPRCRWPPPGTSPRSAWPPWRPGGAGVIAGPPAGGSPGQ